MNRQGANKKPTLDDIHWQKKKQTFSNISLEKFARAVKIVTGKEWNCEKKVAK